MTDSPVHKTFSVRTEQHRGATLVIPTGELDIATAPELEHALTDGRTTCVVLDLRELEFIDSSGLRTLLTAHRHAERAGSEFKLVAGNRVVERLLEIAGVHKMFVWTTAGEIA